MWTLQKNVLNKLNLNEKSLTLQSRFKQQDVYACGKGNMVSRRRILSRSRDDLNLDNFPEEEEDVWHIKEKLYKDHIQEVLDKWHQIDDEIWAKLIVMERNRRVAKAYARAPALQINGSDDGFDGYRIGLNGFDNPLRDARTEEVKRQIGNGIKVRMDDSGNILIKRVSKSNVYIKNTTDDNSIGSDILKLPQGALDYDKAFILFDMKKFQQNVSRELKRAYPDRRKLETQCVTSIAFARNETEVLDCPCWVMIINMVAMDMLKSKLPPVKRNDIRSRPRIPIPDEDPYSVAGSGSSGSSQNSGKDRKSSDKPPKLPPRDSSIYESNIPKPDYDEPEEPGFKPVFASTRTSSKDKSSDKKYDDPYYCGLRARIPNYAKNSSKDKKDHKEQQQQQQQEVLKKQMSSGYQTPLPMHPMWHSRSYDSGMASLPASTPDLQRLYAYSYAQMVHHQQHAAANYALYAAPETDLTDCGVYGRYAVPLPRSYVAVTPSRNAIYRQWD